LERNRETGKMSSLRAFNNLQKAIIERSEFQVKQLKQALLFRPESPETYAVFRLSLISKKLDPSHLFIETSIMAMRYDRLFLRYAALALRYGADPNSYVKAKFSFTTVKRRTNKDEDSQEDELEEEETVEIPIHIAKRLWDITPRNEEESLQEDYDLFGYFELAPNEENQGEDNSIPKEDAWRFKHPESDEQAYDRYRGKQITLMDLLSMMAIKGFSPDLTISNTGLLADSGINPTKFTINNPQFFNSVYADIKLDESNPSLSDAIAEEIRYFIEWKGSLQSIYGIDPDRDIRLLNYAILLDLPEILSLSDIYGVVGNLKEMFIFQDNESLKVVIPRLKDIDLIGNSSDESSQKQLELQLFNWGIEYYNQIAITLLLDIGIMPDYSIRSATIKASKNIYKSYPVLCQIINRCIIDYVERGYGLNSEQMRELSFAPDVQDAIRQEYSTPTWTHMCRVGGNNITPDMKEIAREIGIPIGSTKEQICNTFEGLSKSDPSTVKQTLHRVNKNHIVVELTSASDVIAGRKALVEPIQSPNILVEGAPETVTLRNDKGKILSESGSATALGTKRNPISLPKGASQSKNQGICSNGSMLERSIEDVPDIDRVTYNDGSDTWCLLSNDWPDLIKTKENPWVRNSDGSYGAPIPSQVVDEMERKSNLIKSEELDPQLSSIDDGVNRLFDANPARTQEYYDRSANRRLEEFYKFTESYGVPRETFKTLKREDYQNLSDEILSPVNKLDVDVGPLQALLNDFADRVLIEIENFQSPDDVGNSLYSLLMT
jgi:hypothetical protein